MSNQGKYVTETDSVPIASLAYHCPKSLTEAENVLVASGATHGLQVEYEIMTAYIQNKTSQLDAVLEVLFQDTAAWPAAPPPTYLRDACLEVVYTLVGGV